MPAFPFRLTIVAAAVAAAMVPVHAQQAPVSKEQAPAADSQKIQQVEVKGAAASYDPRRDDTASKIVVNNEEIVKYGDTNVLDVLKRVPGVTVSSSGRGGEIRMRGLGNGYTQILLNGERAPAGFDISSLSPEVIERIEVLRAASAEFSTQSIAGTINVVLKKSVKAAQRELKLGYGHGAAQNSPTASLQLSDKLGKLSYSFAMNVFQNRFTNEPETIETFFNPAGVMTGLRQSKTPQDARISAVNLTPRINYTFGNGDTLTSQTFANWANFSQVEAGRIETLLGPIPAYPRLDQSMTNHNHVFREELNWVHKFESGAKLDAKLSGLYVGAGNSMYRFGGGNPAASPLSAFIESDAAVRGLTSTGKYTSSRFEGHALAFGWDGGYQSGDDRRLERDAAAPTVSLPGGDEFYESAVSRLAVYGQDEWNVTPAWSVYLGARWEGIRTSTEGNTYAQVKNNSSVLSPIAQTLYKIPGTKGDQLRLAVTRTYKAPNQQQIIPHRFTSVNNSQTEPDSIGNPNLKPELALGIDASWEHYWAEGALLSASVSSRRITDYTRSLVVFDGARWVSTPTNSGNAKTYGVELEAKFPLKAVMETTTNLDLRASLSRNWSTVDSVPGPDNRLDGQTPLSATLGADYKTGALTLGGSYVFKNGGFVRVSGNQISYQSVRRDLDLYALWKFTPKLQLRVATSNLLAQDVISQSSYTTAAGTQTSRTLNPVHRSVRATVEMKF
ncbi:TonB-dependent siderophore receptor [Massilia sp. Bi118]|uniref:TonB-dependent receptor plug domain-containing protein n=1 Tax=Massilia sp. Bi118 TaxID=2822346 RepID=UPI001E3244BC|nr:TonB-dependent receptor [Massilia sp. Bi118]